MATWPVPAFPGPELGLERQSVPRFSPGVLLAIIGILGFVLLLQSSSDEAPRQGANSSNSFKIIVYIIVSISHSL